MTSIGTKNTNREKAFNSKIKQRSTAKKNQSQTNLANDTINKGSIRVK